MTRSIRNLYAARVALALMWVSLLSAVHPVRALGVLADVLLIA